MFLIILDFITYSMEHQFGWKKCEIGISSDIFVLWLKNRTYIFVPLTEDILDFVKFIELGIV